MYETWIRIDLDDKGGECNGLYGTLSDKDSMLFDLNADELERIRNHGAVSTRSRSDRF